MRPRTAYARQGNVHIAYQVFGEGAADLVIVPGFISHLEHMWDEPSLARFLERLGSFCRVIAFDKRGTGLSDRPGKPPTLEERMEDVHAVMDAVRSERAALFGISEGGPMSVLFAATYPERTSALILYGTWAKGLRSEDYPWNLSREQYERWITTIPESWGDPGTIRYWAPTAIDDVYLREWWGKMQRLGASPGAVIELIRLYQQIDVRPILSSIQVPTLVLHRRGDRAIKVEAGRHLAEHIPGARFVELEGVDHLWWVHENGAITAEIEEFLTGVRPPVTFERTLATVLFTDIVGSTARAIELGDGPWRELLERHDQLIRRAIARYQGREIKSTGDGFLILFEGPSRAIRCAQEIREAVKPLGIEIRAGIHTGEVERMGNELGGVAVHLASRVTDHAGADAIFVTGTVKDLVVGSGIEFEDRGPHVLKGLEGEWRLYSVRAP